LLYFRLAKAKVDSWGGYKFCDKIPLKFSGWTEEDFALRRIRCSPGSIVRRTSYLADGVILMPSFVNVGAYVGPGTMIDTWSTVGSCAYVGANCHISGGVGLGGVLEPVQAMPVIIEDNCIIGARSQIAEGTVVESGSVIAMGVYIGASTRIVDRDTGEVLYGRVPRNSVVVPGTYTPTEGSARGSAVGCGIACAVIVKRIDDHTRDQVMLNEILRCY
jgi:2,3,4,5-tetrahydropyridine-2-carboxylate N-succinyltransferase